MENSNESLQFGFNSISEELTKEVVEVLKKITGQGTTNRLIEVFFQYLITYRTIYNFPLWKILSQSEAMLLSQRVRSWYVSLTNMSFEFSRRLAYPPEEDIILEAKVKELGLSDSVESIESHINWLVGVQEKMILDKSPREYHELVQRMLGYMDERLKRLHGKNELIIANRIMDPISNKTSNIERIIEKMTVTEYQKDKTIIPFSMKAAFINLLNNRLVTKILWSDSEWKLYLILEAFVNHDLLPIETIGKTKNTSLMIRKFMIKEFIFESKTDVYSIKENLDRCRKKPRIHTNFTTKLNEVFLQS
jgi:hypothetical protein